MAATVVLTESNGAVPTVTSGIANLNFGSVDSPNLVVATNPIVVGSLSFAKYLRVEVTAMGGANQIDTIKFWKSSGTYLTGEEIFTTVGAAGYVDLAYATPDATNHRVAWGNQAIPTVAGGDPQRLKIAGNQAGNFTVAGLTDYFGLQLITTLSTPAGSAHQKTITVRWNET